MGSVDGAGRSPAEHRILRVLNAGGTEIGRGVGLLLNVSAHRTGCPVELKSMEKQVCDETAAG